MLGRTAPSTVRASCSAAPAGESTRSDGPPPASVGSRCWSGAPARAPQGSTLAGVGCVAVGVEHDRVPDGVGRRTYRPGRGRRARVVVYPDLAHVGTEASRHQRACPGVERRARLAQDVGHDRRRLTAVRVLRRRSARRRQSAWRQRRAWPRSLSRQGPGRPQATLPVWLVRRRDLLDVHGSWPDAGGAPLPDRNRCNTSPPGRSGGIVLSTTVTAPFGGGPTSISTR